MVSLTLRVFTALLLGAMLVGGSAQAKDGKSALLLPDWERTVHPTSLVLTPKDLKNNSFLIGLNDPVSFESQSFEDWFDQLLDEEEAQFSRVLVRRPAEESGALGRYAFRKYLNKQETRVDVHYYVFNTGPDQGRLISVVTTDPALMKRFNKATDEARSFVLGEGDQAYMAPLAFAYLEKIIAKSAQKKERAKKKEKAEKKQRAKKAVKKKRKRSTKESGADRAKRRQAERAAKRAKYRASISTAPGEGVPFEEIEAITDHMDYQPSAMGGLDITRTRYLLLKDGTAYKNPTVPPSDFDAEASRKIEPKRWYVWKRNDGRYVYRRDESKKWNRVPGSVVKPATERTIEFHGEYIRAWGGAGLGGGFTQRFVTLEANGRLETSSFSFAGGDSAVTPAASVARSEGKDGKTVTASSPVMPILLNGTKRTATKGGSDHTGDYALDGYTIEILTDNGQWRRSFFFVPHKNAIAINGTVYSKPK